MKRHSTDMVALLFGLALCTTGTAFVVHETTGRAIDPAWVSAVGFVVLGCIALAATLLRRPAAPDRELDGDHTIDRDHGIDQS